MCIPVHTDTHRHTHIYASRSHVTSAHTSTPRFPGEGPPDTLMPIQAAAAHAGEQRRAGQLSEGPMDASSPARCGVPSDLSVTHRGGTSWEGSSTATEPCPQPWPRPPASPGALREAAKNGVSRPFTGLGVARGALTPPRGLLVPSFCGFKPPPRPHLSGPLSPSSPLTLPAPDPLSLFVLPQAGPPREEFSLKLSTCIYFGPRSGGRRSHCLSQCKPWHLHTHLWARGPVAGGRAGQAAACGQVLEKCLRAHRRAREATVRGHRRVVTRRSRRRIPAVAPKPFL